MHMKHRKSLGDIRSKLGGSGQRAGMCPNCNQVTPAGGKRKSSDLRERQAPSVSASVTEFCYDKPGMTMPGRSRQYLFLTAIYTFWVYAVFNL